MEPVIHKDSKIDFWKNKMIGATKTAPYQRDSEESNHSLEINNLQVDVPSSLSDALLTMSKGKSVNVYKIFMAGVSIVSARYNLYRELLLTTPSFNLDECGFDNDPTLLLFRLNVDRDDVVKEVFKKIHIELTSNLGNQDYNYSEFTSQELDAKNSWDIIGGTGLYFDEINTWVKDLEKVSCLFRITKNEEQIGLSIDYHQNTYSQKEIAFFGNHVVKAIAVLISDLNQRVDDLNFGTEGDQHLLLNEFNATQVEYDPVSVLTQFETQVLQTPNAIAAKSGSVALSYTELNEEANRLAHYLLDEYGLKRQEKVALMVDRSEKVLIGILAILKAGGVYIPIDLSAPKERIDYFLEDSKCAAVVTEDKYMDGSVMGSTPAYVSIDSCFSEKTENPVLISAPEDLVYVIYTSGTTGKPKGSMIFHTSLSNHVQWFKKKFDLTPNDSTMLINSYSFDGCYSYLWATLTSGGTLHIPNDPIFDPDAILTYIKEEAITFLKLVPSTFGVLVNSETFQNDPTVCQSIRLVKQGGETINVNNLRTYLEKYPEIILGNHYGATECTIGSVAHWITKDTIDAFAKQPVLGAPYDNQQVYVVNEKNELLPIGVFGEICIGGDGVGNGYLHREELTALKFINNPYVGSEKLYKTGDLGRWLPDGTLEFVGRLDNQVKIRGYRIELDEISEAAKDFPLIRDAVSLVHTEEGQDYIALWFMGDATIDKASIQGFLEAQLPPYMLPHYYVQLKRIPLTPNGKIDKKALPDPIRFGLQESRKILTPTNETEQVILEIWQALLGKEDISIDDNFFEIGGHSLKATQLVARMHQTFNKRVPLRDIFFNPTIEDLSLLITNKDIGEAYNDITLVPHQEHYALSHSQKRMWLTYQVQEDKTVYNIPHAIRLIGDVNTEAFDKAVQVLIARHEILRTLFISVAGEPRQQVLTPEAANFKLKIHDIRTLEDSAAEAKRIATAEANTVFQLDKTPPLSAQLIRVDEAESVFLFTLHHIISDGWSTQVFTTELLSYYEAFSQEMEVQPSPLKIQYKDFAQWQNSILDQEEANAHRTYWMNQFSGELSTLELPIDNHRTKGRTYKGGTKTLILPNELDQKLKEYTQRNDVTLFMALMAAVKIILHKYTQQEDIIVGTPIAGREHADLIDQIGFYVNTLAIRSTIKAPLSFDEIVSDTKTTLLDSYQHQVYPFDKLVEDLNIIPEAGRSPLFDVMVVMQNNAQTTDAQFEGNGLKVADYDSPFEVSKFDLLFSFSEEKEGLNLGLEYSTDLFSEAKIDRLLNHFQELLSLCLDQPEQSIGSHKYVTEKELMVIDSFTGVSEQQSSFSTIIDLFQEQVVNTPEAIAVSDENTTYTYAELDQKATKIAHYLQAEWGIQTGDIVAVVCGRNANFITSMLGVLKSGAAYLPLDLTIPTDRIRNLISYTEAKALITDSKELKTALNLEEQTIFLPHLKEIQVDPTVAFNPVSLSQESLAYVMFTSGTTGVPKGVMVSHKNIVRLVRNTNYTVLTAKDRILQTGALSFDAATFEIWGPLLNGGGVHIMTLESLLDIESLAQTIEEKEITKMWFTSSWFNQLADINATIFKSLDQVLVGGEKLSPPHIQLVQNACPELTITNGYGPTENTTFSICGAIETGPAENIPLGTPITNSTVHILDAQLAPVPIGISGELYLGGAGLSQGYINDPDMTAEKFIPSPFAEGKLLYKSGDVGRWMEDGRVLFLGRTDEQVKIRGHRIELAEIETVLQSHPVVNDVKIISWLNEEGEKVLIGYYTISNSIDTSELRSYLHSELPTYMVPTYLIEITAMPLNKNGKVDSGNLPAPTFSDMEVIAYLAPSTKTEHKLVALFSELLDMETAKISINANFFELGGHSLKAILLGTLIGRELGVDISVKTIFSADSLRDLAKAIDTAEQIEELSICKAPELELYPVTPAQLRLYSTYKLNPDTITYNVPGVLELPSKYTLEEVQMACQQLVDRHESLRTLFGMHDQEVYQKVVPVLEIEVAQLPKEDIEEALDAFITPFNLEQDALIRIGFMQEEQSSWLLLDMHHIIVDGLSQSILTEELFDLLEARVLAPTPYQYKDYAWWLNQPEQLESAKAQETYWLDRYETHPPKLSLPTEVPNKELQNTSAGTAQFQLSKENAAFLKNLGKKQGTTLYTTTLAIWSILLSKLSGVEDISIGSPVLGRRHPDVMTLVGMFVNTLAIRLYPKGSLQFSEYLQQVKQYCVEDFENQEYPFESLVEAISDHRDGSRNPIFDTMFSLLTREEFKLEFDEVSEAIVFDEKKLGTKFDLNFKLTDMEDRVVCILDYDTQLFTQSTIQRMLEKFISMIEQLRNDVEVTLSEITIISEEEKEELVYTINATEVVFPNADKTIDQLFEEKATLFPNKIALVDNDSSLTMAEISAKSNQLAAHIVSMGAKANDLVGILLTPSVDCMVAILGIFKAGCAYVPIDTELPTDRMNHILDDSCVQWLVSTPENVQGLSFEGSLIELKTLKVTAEDHSAKLPVNSSENVAYVIYTSGSTGKPKGVPILQNQLVNYVNWFTDTLQNDETDSTVLVSSFSFDIGNSAIFPSLANAGTLHILRKEAYLAVDDLGAYLSDHNISFMKITPTFFSAIINHPKFEKRWLESLKNLMLGGEAILTGDLELFFDQIAHTRVINHYGPTEGTIGCITKQFTKDTFHQFKTNPVIGRPISNMQVYLLDANLQPVPKGAIGQLYLSGTGISTGYLNRPDLTSEKFQNNPWKEGTTLYATGDLGVWNANGELQFKGRADDQVKIRGYRVELEEITTVIKAVSWIQNAAVLIKEVDANDKMIIAYVEAKEDLDVDALRHHLEEVLPNYMVPAFFVAVDTIPMTANAKIDRKALLATPILDYVSGDSEVASNETEVNLLTLWSEILGVSILDINANFFKFGGHSLRALKVINYIEQQWHLKLPLRVFFENPTVKGLAEYLDRQEVHSYQGITTAEIQEHYPLSHSQKRLWLLHEFSESKVAYNVPRVYWLEGKLNEGLLKRAFIETLKRHEILRTVFKIIDGEPRQFILPMETYPDFFSVENLYVEEEQLTEFISRAVNKSFDLLHGPLIDVKLYKKHKTKSLLIFNLHHIVSDGWSAGIMLYELCERYNAYVKDAPVVLEELNIQYKDYAVWQHQQFNNETLLKSHKEFWKNKLSGELPRFSLPETYPRSVQKEEKGKTLNYTISNRIVGELEEMAIANHASLYMVLLAAFNALCYRYTGQKDIIIGTVVAGREKEELAHQLGFYVNTLAQRTLVNGTESFEELLASVKEDILDTTMHQNYPFDLVISELELPQNDGRPPLFDTMFVHQNNEDEDDYQMALDGLELQEISEDLAESKFDVSFVTRKSGDDLHVFVEYNACIYSESFLKSFLKHFEALLTRIIENSAHSIDAIDYLGTDHRNALLTFNKTDAQKTFTTMHAQFEQVVAESPESLAIIGEDVTMTYSELNERANQMAAWILDHYEVGTDDVIAFHLERSEWQIISILAILKAGAGFLPIDVKQPTKRIEFIIEDAKPLCIITDTEYFSIATSASLVYRPTLVKELEGYAKTNLDKKGSSEDLAYVIYTSGSTGKPKGVMIEHRGNLNMVSDQIRQFEITPEDRCLQFASISFDASVYEIGIGLFSGSTLVLLTDQIIADPLRFTQYIKQNKVTFATLPPVYLSSLDSRELIHLKVLVTAGEAPNIKDAHFLSQHLNYYNAYGPTEYSVCASVHKVQGDERVIPIGQPLDNTKIHILDASRNEVAIGCWGEICLAGAGIARGYLNRPEQNEEKFIQNPFDSKQKLYCSGDLGRWLEDGTVEFFGRKDDMIKIRGYRVEIAEIEYTMLEHEYVKEVVIKYDRIRQILIAYVVADLKITTQDLTSYVEERLPAYMTPSFINIVESIPLTTNGKVNYALLPLITEEKRTTNDIRLPADETEEMVVQLWAKVLGLNVDRISTHDNFFELGGQSILVMKFIAFLWKDYGKDLSLRDFMNEPTVKGIASRLKSNLTKRGLIVPLNNIVPFKHSLFMIPPIVGSASIFRSLAYNLREMGIKCYGVQYRGFDYDEAFDVSISVMAQTVVTEIKPYISEDKEVNILGYSMGAIIAAETVALLESEGYTVNLILVDKGPEDTFPTSKSKLSKAEEEAMMKELVGKHFEGIELPEHNVVRMENLLRHNIALLKAHHFDTHLTSDILALEAKETKVKNKMVSWGDWTEGEFIHQRMEGTHFDILQRAEAFDLYQSIHTFINKNTN